MPTAVCLALKETWRNRGRFLLLSLVITLITLLILFIAVPRARVSEPATISISSTPNSSSTRTPPSDCRSLINNPTVVLDDKSTASLDLERAYQVV